MDPNQNNEDDLSSFLSSESTSSAASVMPGFIVRDLVVSKSRLTAVYAGGSVLGYLLSLAVCAQCSIGISPLSWKTASWLHTIPDPWCPLLCGFVFGISPTLASMLLLNRFQHRFLLFRMRWLPILVPIAGSLLLLLGGAAHSWSWHGVWLLAALVTPYFIESCAAMVLRQTKWKAES